MVCFPLEIWLLVETNALVWLPVGFFGGFLVETGKEVNINIVQSVNSTIIFVVYPQRTMCQFNTLIVL